MLTRTDTKSPMSSSRRVALAATILAVITTASLLPTEADAAPHRATWMREAVTRATPESVKRSIQNRSADANGAFAIQHQNALGLTTVPRDPSSGVSVADRGQQLRISLPSADRASDAMDLGEGMVMYDNKDGSATVPVVVEDGSIQINTVIESAAAPTEYAYSFDLPEGAVAKELEGGLIFFYGADGAFLGGLAPAWAKDAEGEEVATHYRVEGNRVTQVVEHGAQHRYPVVADPWLGLNLFAYVSSSARPAYRGQPVYTMELSTWGQTIYRGSAALGLKALPPGVGLPVTWLGYKIMTNEGWSEVVSRQPGARTVSVQQQYVCHVRYGYPVLGSGWRWDLERARPPKYNWTRTNVLNHRCNW